LSIVVIIPAYKPDATLVTVASELDAAPEVASIIVVNDGSGPACAGVFESVSRLRKVTVLRHGVNLGKGAALRTGLNHFQCEFPSGQVVVTADADGQHLPEDIIRIGREAAQSPDALVLGARRFDSSTPLRSRFGNVLTRHVLRWAVGARLTDTQTGLRAIPRELIPSLLRVPARGYEFELDMLLLARQRGHPMREVPIQTVYEPGNPSSHFDPLLDSARIYFVLLRFTLVAVFTAALDFSVFSTVLTLSESTLQAQIGARAVALLFNYFALRRIVFYSDRRHKVVFPSYVLVVACSGTVAYAMLRLFMHEFAMPALAAKACAELLVFLANFAVLREYIFFPKKDAQG
jgi:glycosyltransferase involved in cell wall biosynthesis